MIWISSGIALAVIVYFSSLLVRDRHRVERERKAWEAEQASITEEERRAATEMTMHVLATSLYAWKLLVIDPAMQRRTQTKAYAVAAVKWKKMNEELRYLERVRK